MLPPALRDLDLRRKIAAVAVVPTVLLVAAFLVVFAVQRSRLAGQIETQVSRLAEENVARAARDLRTLCEATHRELLAQVPRSLRVARAELDRIGRASIAPGEVRWRALNQLDGTTTDLVLPRLLLGSSWAGQNADPATPSLLVDRVRELVGAEVTLFQKINPRGDMMRVATTVRDRSGMRAIGTYIPAVDPDGQPNPVLSTVLSGQTYQGRARVLDEWYLAGYEPLRDASGAIIGMLFIGLRQDSLEGIRAGVAASRIGESGVLYVLGGHGNQRGRYLIAPPGGVDGESMWGAIDGRGAAYVREIVQAAVAAPPGDAVQVGYARGSGSEAREKLASVTYFAPWDWVIVAELDRAETVKPLREMQESLGTAVSVVVAVAAVLLLLATWTARTAAARIAAPIEAMTVAAERIARGDVDQQVTYQAGDEVGRLAEAFRGTIDYIHDVARGAEALARGDLSTPLVERSDRDELTRSFRSAQSELRRVVDEMHALAGAAVEGRLEVRADATRYSGEFRRIVEGANATLATLVQHLDAMPAPAMIVSPDFDIRYMNQTGAGLLGRSQRELVGTKCYDSFRMGDCCTHRCASARAMRDDREVTSETEAHPEGLALDIVYSAVPLHDEAGRVVGAFEIVSDQTALRVGDAAPRAIDAPDRKASGR